MSDNADVKTVGGKVLNAQSREIIFNLYNFMKREADVGPILLQQVQKRVAEATGVSRSTIQRILKQRRNPDRPVLSSSSVKLNKTKKKTVIGDFEKVFVRNTIHEFLHIEMGIDFYYTPGSSPCRSVLLAAKAVGVDLNLKQLDLMKGEHLKPEFVKINPQHNVPTLDDNGFAINESRAIITYLAEKYGKNDSLYPKDPKKRALVNQRLYFDMGTLYQRFGDLYYPVMFGGAPFDEEKKKKLDEAYGFLDKYLEGAQWAAGDNYTLADIALVASVSTAEVVGYDVSKYPNVAKWLSKAKSTLPGYADANEKGVQMFKGMFEALTKKA